MSDIQKLNQESMNRKWALEVIHDLEQNVRDEKGLDILANARYYIAFGVGCTY